MIWVRYGWTKQYYFRPIFHIDVNSTLVRPFKFAILEMISQIKFYNQTFF